MKAITQTRCMQVAAVAFLFGMGIGHWIGGAEWTTMAESSAMSPSSKTDSSTTLSSSSSSSSSSLRATSSTDSDSSTSSAANVPSTQQTDGEEFSLAKKDSFGFFNNIRNEDWLMQRDRARNFGPHELDPSKKNWHITDLAQAGRFYLENWHPDFTCPHERMYGRIRDGHKFVCDAHRLREKKDCLVYSIGSDNDFSFESALYAAAPNCEIHIFDFGDYGQSMKTNWKNLTATYHRNGLTGVGKEKNLLLSFPNILKELGHENRRIDILKVDCESCEWDAYPDILAAPNHISQLLVETHRVRSEFFHAVHDAGYALFHKEPNTVWQGGCEWSFLKLDKSFWKDDE